MVLVVSCDTLVPIDGLWQSLAQQHQYAPETQVCYLKDTASESQQDYPLLGLYRMDILDKLCHYLDSNARAVMKFLATIDAQTQPLPTAWCKLANLNTPCDFEQALCIVKSIKNQHSK